MKRTFFLLYPIALMALIVTGCTDDDPVDPDPDPVGGGQVIFGVDDDNMLVSFYANAPGTLRRDVAITGVTGSQKIVAIDFRPSDRNDDGTDRIGMLYGVTDGGILYTIDTLTGAASNETLVSTPIFAGVAGFGFNPVADRLRIHGSDGQSLRINSDNGITATDTSLAYMAGDANAGQTPAIAAAAYTNSDNDTLTATLLFAIDAARDVLVDIPSANTGQLRTIGPLGVDINELGGFDIVGTAGGTAYAALTIGGTTKLYTINLTTGAATAVGVIGDGMVLVSIAAP
jgi:hypothetical protein